MAKNNDYNFDLIISSDDLKRNKEKCLTSSKIIVKKRKLKRWVKNFLVGLMLCVAILLFIAIGNYFDREMEKHIEIVSKECASQGYGITAKYTKEWDKYYVCKK